MYPLISYIEALFKNLKIIEKYLFYYLTKKKKRIFFFFFFFFFFFMREIYLNQINI